MSETPQSTHTSENSSELQQKVNALRALSVINSLLHEGTFKHSYSELISKSLAFVAALHSQVSDEALSHPDHETIPELVELKKMRMDHNTPENQTPSQEVQ